MNRRTLLGGASLCVAAGTWALLLSGCPTPPVEEPDPCDKQIVTLKIYASDFINPNENERPRPVVVRLYQLASDLKMLNARYDDILLRDAEVLGADLLKVDEVVVYPNGLHTVVFERIEEASVLAGAAMMHGPQGHSWKTYYEFPPLPNTPEACLAGGGGGGAPKPEEPQAYPETAFFVVERKIDNGSQYDESMFPDARPYDKINLPPRSANTDAFAEPGARGGGVKGKGP